MISSQVSPSIRFRKHETCRYQTKRVALISQISTPSLQSQNLSNHINRLPITTLLLSSSPNCSKMAPIDDSDYANPISLLQILFLILLNFLLERFFSGLFYIFLLWVALLFYFWNSWVAHRSNDAAEATCTPSVRRNAQQGEHCSELVKLSIDDVKTMMEAVDGDNLGLKAAEIEGLFDEELRFGEVEEAFDLFDEDGDGFIDAEDLKKVLCGLGFRVASQVDQCRRMISAYDYDGDGRLNLKEFAKLVQQSFL